MTSLGTKTENNSDAAGIYSFRVVGFLILFPFILMFFVPLVVYGGRISVLTVHGIYDLESSDLLKTMAVVLTWGGIAIGACGMISRFILRAPRFETSVWAYRHQFRLFVLLAIFSAPVFLVHQLVIFPSVSENLIHLASSAIYWAIGIGICTFFRPEAQKSRIHQIILALVTLGLFGLAAFIPLVLGKSAGAAQASLVAVTAICMVRTPVKVRVVVAAVFVGVACFSMVVKNPVRLTLHQGAVFQRVPLHHASWEWLESPSAVFALGDANSEGGGGVLSSDLENFSLYDQNYDHILLPESWKHSFLYSAIGRVTHRLNHLSYLGHVMKRTPAELPFIGNQTYAPLAGFFVPRFVWQEKPTTSYANTFGRRYGFLAENDFQTCQNFNAVTEAWMSGGWPVVVWSGLGWGALFGALMGWFGRGGDQNVRVIVALTLAYQAASFESETALALGGILHGLIVIGLLYTANHVIRTLHREIAGRMRLRT